MSGPEAASLPAVLTSALHENSDRDDGKFLLTSVVRVLDVLNEIAFL